MGKLDNERSFLTLEKASEILRELVLIPSSANDDKRPIIEHVRNFLEGFEFKCQLLGNDECPVLLVQSGKGGILLSGHLDTVPIGEGWTVDQGEIGKHTLYGRGATDMKGGCAAMMMTAAELHEKGIPASMVLTTDEETGMGGADIIAESDIISQASAIIICEPTNLKIGLREKGLLQVRITTRGTAAHAAMPEEGDNAIHRMLALVERIRSMMRQRSDDFDDVSLNVGVIRGGEKVNVIPDHCYTEIDFRTPEKLHPDELLAMIRENVEDIDHELEIMNRLKPVSTPEDAKIVKLISKLIPGIEMSEIIFVTEMVKFNEKNPNIVALGPGDPRQAHKSDEHIDLHQVLAAAELYCGLCLGVHARGKNDSEP